MDIFQAVILGLVQGLGEFLPISSSAHLVLVPWLFNWEDPGLTFDIALHIGTLIAVALVSQGVARSLIEVEYYGKEKLLVSTPDGIDEPKNHGVEIIVE